MPCPQAPRPGMRRPPGLREPAAMDAALAAVAAMHGGVFTRQQALTCGVSDMALLGLTRGKEVITLGRSAYAVASAVPDRAQPGYDVAFHALRARAALLVYPDAHLCGVSLLAVAGVDIYGADLRRVELVRDVRQEVLTQLCRIRPRHAVIRPGLPKDPSPRAEGVAEAIAGAVVQLAMDHGFLAGVCSADDAMHDGWTTREDLVVQPSCIASSAEQTPARKPWSIASWTTAPAMASATPSARGDGSLGRPGRMTACRGRIRHSWVSTSWRTSRTSSTRRRSAP